MTPPKLKLKPELLEAFNVYRTQPLQDVLDQPQIFAFVGGLVVNSKATVISADPGGVVLQDFITTARIKRADERDDAGTSVCRAVLELDSYPALKRALRRYVARRQRDILTELGLSEDVSPDDRERPEENCPHD